MITWSAGFAVNLDLLLSKPAARINPDAARGFLESSIIEKLINGMEELEAKADDCNKVYSTAVTGWYRYSYCALQVSCPVGKINRQ